MTFAEHIEQAAGNEEILGCVIGEFTDDDLFLDEEPFNTGDKRFRLLTWQDARPLLDYNYKPSYGLSMCHAIYAWTPTRTLFTLEYDGKVEIATVPRNPVDIRPQFKGLD